MDSWKHIIPWTSTIRPGTQTVEQILASSYDHYARRADTAILHFSTDPTPMQSEVTRQVCLRVGFEEVDEPGYVVYAVTLTHVG